MRTKTKKKNPADLTARNNNALKKRILALEKKVSLLIGMIKFAMLEEK